MLANTCLADNLSTLSTFNWGKLQLLNVDFFVYIKLSTFLCQKAVSPCISTLSCVFHKMRFSWNSFLSTLSTLLKTLDLLGLLAIFFFSFLHSCAIIWDGLMDRIFHPALYERKEHNGKYNTS